MEERGSWISNNGRVAPPITATILTRLLLLSGGRGGFIRHARLMIDAWSPYEYYRLLMINWRREAGSRCRRTAYALCLLLREREVAPGHITFRAESLESPLWIHVLDSSFLSPFLVQLDFFPTYPFFFFLSDWSVHFCPVKGWFEWTSSFKLLTSDHLWG